MDVEKLIAGINVRVSFRRHRLLQERAQRRPPILGAKLEQPVRGHGGAYMLVMAQEARAQLAPVSPVGGRGGPGREGHLQDGEVLADVGLEAGEEVHGLPLDDGVEFLDGLQPAVGVAAGENDFGVGEGGEEFVGEEDAGDVGYCLCGRQKTGVSGGVFVFAQKFFLLSLSRWF